MNPLIQQLEDILDTILQAVEEILYNGEELPDDLQNMVAEEILLLTQEIEELYAEEGAAEQLQPVPELDQGPFPSSNINSFKYDPKNQQLWVKFHGKDTANSGLTYTYQNVPEFIFDVFRRGAVGPKTSGRNRYHTWHRGVTPSLGAAMSALIKAGGYPYQRLS